MKTDKKEGIPEITTVCLSVSIALTYFALIVYAYIELGDMPALLMLIPFFILMIIVEANRSQGRKGYRVFLENQRRWNKEDEENV